MVKRGLLWILFTPLLFADLLEDKIIDLVSSHTYERNKRFIERLFEKREDFFINGRMDFAKMTQRLKENGLLNLTFGAPKELYISFKTSSSALLFAKSLSSSLQSLGYYYFAPKIAEYQDGNFTLGVAMTTERAIDPTLLIRELEKRGYRVMDLQRERDDRWHYLIELVSPVIPEAELLIPEIPSEVMRPSGEYWFDLGDSSGALFVAPAMNVRIHLNVTFFDASLRIISSHQPKEKEYLVRESGYRFRVDIPRGVRFVRLSDLYSPVHVKGGIKIYLLP